MKPKEEAKATKLFIKYWKLLGYSQQVKEEAKQCALIAVDEILKIPNIYVIDHKELVEHWKEVKNEIEKL